LEIIDDIIVWMEIEERHNELVAEILKILEENNLYMKLEKYKWNVRLMKFGPKFLLTFLWT